MTLAPLVRLLETSLPQWGRAGTVTADEASVRIDSGGQLLHVRSRDVPPGTVPPGSPDRVWEVAGDELTETAPSVVGVRLLVRRRLEPGFVPGRAIVGQRPQVQERPGT